jgi:hypothetical protein
MFDALVIDADAPHAEKLIRRLGSRNLRIDLVRSTTEAISKLRYPVSPYELVIVNTSDASHPWLAILDRLQEVCRQPGSHSKPLFLCVSNRQRDPHFELEIERRGARYAYER